MKVENKTISGFNLIIKYIFYIVSFYLFLHFEKLVSFELIVEISIVSILFISFFDYIFNNLSIIYFPYINKNKDDKKKNNINNNDDSLIDTNSLDLITNDSV